MSSSLPATEKLKLAITVREMDSFRDKRISELLFDLFKKSGIEGATVMRAVRGFDRRGFATLGVLGLLVKLPIVIETVDEHQKIIPLLSTIKEMVGSNGLITISEVYVP